jgi:hypothetical protein
VSQGMATSELQLVPRASICAASASRKAQYIRKVSSTLILTATGLPSFIAGSNVQRLTASDKHLTPEYAPHMRR